MMFPSRLFIGFVVALLMQSLATPTLAQELMKTVTAAELGQLPSYCKDTQGNTQSPQQYERWKAKLGDTFSHMHHYCNGLVGLLRAGDPRQTPQQRMHLLGVSVSEFNYVIERSPADFVVLPEILTKRGQSLMGLKRYGEALPSLQKAIELKPDYWPPYAYLSDFYRDTGDLAKARQVLDDGLKRIPEAQALIRRKSELEQSGRKAPAKAGG